MSTVRLVRATGTVAILTVISNILGFLRETSLAAVFGTTSDTDAYLVAATIPHLLYGIITYGISTTFIPAYSKVLEERGKAAASQFANTFFWIVLFVGMTLVVVGELFAEQLVRIVAPGFEEQIRKITTHLTRVMLPLTIFQLAIGVVDGLLHINGRFISATIGHAFLNLSVLCATVLFARRYGITAVAVGHVLGAGLSLAVKLHSLFRLGVRWRAQLYLRDAAVHQVVILMLPAFLTAAVTQLNLLIERMLASSLPSGALAALNYATRLVTMGPTIIGTSLATVIYPTLAKDAARGNREQLSERLLKVLTMTLFVLAPISIGVLVLSEPLVRLVFERGSFDPVATKQTAWAVMFLSPTISLVTMSDLVNRAFFSLRDTRTPMFVTVTSVAANIVLNVILVRPLQHGGLALGTTLSTLLSLLLGLWLLRRNSPGGLLWNHLITSVFRVILSGGVMGGFLWLGNRVFQAPAGGNGYIDVLRLALYFGLGIGVYVGVAWVLHTPEVTLVTEMLRGVFDRFLPRSFGRRKSGR